MEHLVYRIGVNLNDQNTISILGPKKVSDRIKNRFDVISWEEICSKEFLFNICRDPISYRIVRLVKYASSWKPDVLIALGSIGVNGLAVAVAGRLIGIPSIVRLTSDIFRVYLSKEKFLPKLRMFIRNNILGFIALNIADRILLLHNSQRKIIESLRIPKNRLFVAPQPIIFPENNSLSKEELRMELGIPNEAIVVLSTMRLDPDKRIDLLIEVIDQVISMNNNKEEVHFVIIGNGECRDKIINNTVKYHSVVHFLKELPRDKLSSYYQMADIYLHLSKSEGLSNCIAEAIYFNLPVIACDSGTITRSMVSNISNDCNEISSMIINKNLKKDRIPKELLPSTNRQLWNQVVKIVSKLN